MNTKNHNQQITQAAAAIETLGLEAFFRPGEPRLTANQRKASILAAKEWQRILSKIETEVRREHGLD